MQMQMPLTFRRTDGEKRRNSQHFDVSDAALLIAVDSCPSSVGTLVLLLLLPFCLYLTYRYLDFDVII